MTHLTRLKEISEKRSVNEIKLKELSKLSDETSKKSDSLQQIMEKIKNIPRRE